MRRVVILGAAGRYFHNFNVFYRDRPDCEVVAFTATRISGIGGRTYPPERAGKCYPDGIPIVPESELAALVSTRTIDEVVFAYSDTTHEQVMHLASIALAAGASFTITPNSQSPSASDKPRPESCCATGPLTGEASFRGHGSFRNDPDSESSVRRSDWPVAVHGLSAPRTRHSGHILRC